MYNTLLFSPDIIICTIIVFVLAVWLHWRWKHRHFLELAAKIPGPRSYPLFGTISMFTNTYDGMNYNIFVVKI